MLNPILKNLATLGGSTSLGSAGSAGILQPGRKPATQAAGSPFDLTLRKALQAQPTDSLHVTAHAEKRLQERQIPFGPDQRSLITQAMNELQAKGARDSLVITSDAAYVVNVPSRTLVTAMDVGEMHDRIVTQIDSVSIKST